MKSKTNRIEKSRLRKDYVFSRVVTIFGLLILATFATLLLHILINASPLLFSPSLVEKQQIRTELNDETGSRLLGFKVVQGEWFSFHVHDCSLILSHIESKDENPQLKTTTFAPDCNKQIITVLGDTDVYIVKISQTNVLEIHQLTDNKSLRLYASFALPQQFHDLNHQSLQFFLQGKHLVMRNEKHNKISLLHYSIGSLEAPETLVFNGLKDIFPVVNYRQYIGITENEIIMFDDKAAVLQQVELDSTILHASVSPSLLDLVLIQGLQTNKSMSLENYQLNMFTLVNDGGNFSITPRFQADVDFELDDSTPTSEQIFLSYDLQNNLVFLATHSGQVFLMNSITGEIQATTRFDAKIKSVSYNRPELLLAYEQAYSINSLQDVQGVVSLNTLFGKNHYSAYSKPEYIWQTSVSSDFQSPKYSVIPLVMGSLKASILALVVALPLALGAAIYTAYFASPKIRNAIKPSIEMLEAIPSVIIGFIAAVWLAPFAQQYLISLFSVLIMLPVIVVVIAAIHGFIGAKFADTVIARWQFSLNLLLLIMAIAFIAILSSFVSDWFIARGGNEILESIASVSLSKTAIVVSLALGVAIAPTIYTLIDDALFEVPDGVKQASFALGATQIQTLVRVVLVVAFPSIISAIMLGFGRAFGETMIVLMVTGNTPIADWDLLSGLRTLTSNLAIELQEAQVDSTLFHVLFLTAAILFMFTFVVNTIAAMLKRQVRNT